MGSIERFAFYDLARKAYCVIVTGERRFYGCFAFKKGVIPARCRVTLRSCEGRGFFWRNAGSLTN
jgi:hypothetical protein